MNKHIKMAIDFVTSHGSSDDDIIYKKMNELVSSGELKPRYHYFPNLNNPLDNTLKPETGIIYSKTEIDEDGNFLPLFKIYANVHDDWYQWIEFFVAVSIDEKQWIFGDYDGVIYTSSKKFLKLFEENTTVKSWDKGDI